MTEKTISGVHVHVSPGSVETLVMRGGIINHHWIAHCLSNIFAKNYENWLMCVEVILCNISVVFRHNVYSGMHSKQKLPSYTIHRDSSSLGLLFIIIYN